MKVSNLSNVSIKNDKLAVPTNAFTKKLFPNLYIANINIGIFKMITKEHKRVKALGLIYWSRLMQPSCPKSSTTWTAF